MTIHTVRRIVFAVFVVYLMAVTWPLVVLFGRAEPMVLGLPLSFAWAIGWIIVGGLALAVLDLCECRHEDQHSRGDR